MAKQSESAFPLALRLRFTLALALLVVTGWQCWRGAQAQSVATLWIVHKHEVLWQLNALQNLNGTIDSRAGVYSVSGQADELARLQIAVRDWETGQQRLSALLRDNPVRGQQVQRLSVLFNEYAGLVRQAAGLRHKQKAEPALQLLRGEHSQNLRTELTRLYNAIEVQETRSLADRIGKSQDAASWVGFFAVGGTLTALLLIGHGLWIIRRDLLPRLPAASQLPEEAGVAPDSTVAEDGSPVAATATDLEAVETLQRAKTELEGQLAEQIKALEETSQTLLAEMTERELAEQELLKAQEDLESRVAQRTTELRNANGALQAEIFERQKAEEALRAAQTQLETRVQQRTTELATINGELRATQARLELANANLLAKNSEIQNFYHTLSHELKTPLTSAREFVSIVMDGLAGPVNQTQLEYLGVAQESCNQLRHCINDLLDATRLETGKLRLDVKVGSLVDLAQRLASVLVPSAESKGIQLIFNAPPGLPDIAFDDHRVTQIITNLVGNALKFTDSGGSVEVTVSEPLEKSDCLEVSVRDTGRGIPADQIEHIFDRLYQIQTGDAASEHGIGLGLYLSRELVLLHGGEIHATSEVGRGSTFSFTLPKTQKAEHRTVLVVDDDAAIVDLMGAVLEREGFTVRTANDGKAALAAMRDGAPDVVLLDLAMPGLDGSAALKEIRRLWGAIPVIVHTGYPQGELMDRALQGAPFALLTKPCQPQQLIEAIRGMENGTTPTVDKLTLQA